MAANVVDLIDATAQGSRVCDAASAISSLSDVYDRNAVSFFKTLDNLLIGLGEPVGMRVTEVGGARSFATDRLDQVEVGPWLDPFDCELRLQVSAGLTSATSAGVVQRGTDFVEQVGRDLLRLGGRNLQRIGQVLEDGFRQVCDGQNDVAGRSVAAAITASDAAQQLEPVFERLERFLLARNHRFHLPHNPSQSRFLFFHRFLGEDGQPQLRLHLLKSQREAIENFVGPAGVDDFQACSKRAFSSRNWSLEERFNTGVSGWIEWPWQRTDDGDADRAAHVLAAALCGVPKGGSTSLRSALAIPVHVDGLPWLGLAGLFGTEEVESALWAQRFYRDLLPYLTTTIRAEAERAYLSAVRDTAKMTASRGYDDAALITQELAALAATFPYQRVLAKLGAQEELASIDWVGGTKLALELADSPVEGGRVDYSRLDQSGLLAAFRDGRNAAEAERTRQLEAQLLTYMDVGHTLKNVVECTGWAVSAESVGRVSNYFEQMVDAGLTSGDIEEIGEALGFADRSLSLFWIMSSLGHFIRLSGANTGSYGWDKFIEWVDLTAPQADPSAFASKYVEAVTRIATALAYGAGWSSVSIANGDGSAPRQWSGAPPDPLDIKSLHLPPFKKGADAGYVFAFCLLEPLLNAIRALGALPPAMLTGHDPPSLDIVLSPNADDHSVAVTISNLCLKKLPPSLSGLRSARAIASSIGLATFLEPKEEPLDSGLYRITSGVIFHPRHIIQAITQAGR